MYHLCDSVNKKVKEIQDVTVLFKLSHIRDIESSLPPQWPQAGLCIFLL